MRFYFDIDGTLGRWYKDGRGYSLEEIIAEETHYFRDIEEHPMMIMLAKTLDEMGHTVCVLSASAESTKEDKRYWVREHLPFVKEENIFFAPLKDGEHGNVKKSDYVIDAENSVLIDDWWVNLKEWSGKAVKAINSINSHQDEYYEIDLSKTEENYLAMKELIEKNGLMGEMTSYKREIKEQAERLIDFARGKKREKVERQ